MAERFRTGLTFSFRERILLALQAGLEGVDPTTLAGEVARREIIAEAEHLLGSLGAHPADGPAAKHATTLAQRLDSQLADHDRALARSDDLDLPAKERRAATAEASRLADAADQVAGELLDALRAVQKARDAHDRADDAVVDRGIEEEYRAGVREEIVALELLRTADAKITAALERSERRHGRGRSPLNPEGRFPFPDLPTDQIARLERILSPPPPRDGRRAGGIIVMPARALRGKASQRYARAVERDPTLTEYVGHDPELETVWDAPIGEWRSFKPETAELLASLRVIRLADPPVPPAPPLAEPLVAVHLLRAVPPNVAGELAYFSRARSEELLAQGAAELPSEPTA